jgi:hypothetical protein
METSFAIADIDADIDGGISVARGPQRRLPAL